VWSVLFSGGGLLFAGLSVPRGRIRLGAISSLYKIETMSEVNRVFSSFPACLFTGVFPSGMLSRPFLSSRHAVLAVSSLSACRLFPQRLACLLSLPRQHAFSAIPFPPACFPCLFFLSGMLLLALFPSRHAGAFAKSSGHGVVC